MISAALDRYGFETGRHYDMSDKSFDVSIDRLGRVFETLKLQRFGTFEEFLKDPSLFYYRASARGDFWPCTG